MRVAALYDIHGNLPALEAVLTEVRATGVDAIVVGGDVLPGPLPRETLACLTDLGLPVHFICGNGDREVLAARAGQEILGVPPDLRPLIEWVAAQITPEQAVAVAGWPATCTLEIPGLGAVLFCHATPRNDTEIFLRTTPADRLGAVFAAVTAPLVVCGHTHMQFDRVIGHTRVVNAGSVGQPYGAPGAYWLLLGPSVELRHSSYDLAAAAARVRATTYPMAEDFAAENILHPPSEEEALAVFTPAAIG